VNTSNQRVVITTLSTLVSHDFLTIHTLLLQWWPKLLHHHNFYSDFFSGPENKLAYLIFSPLGRLSCV